MLRVTSDSQDLSSIVYSVWRCITGEPFDPDMSWEDTGADSMQCMRLILDLEETLACRLSFDVIGPHTSAADLVRILRHRDTPSATSAGPVVFLVPGLHGDEPTLASFRRSFDGRVRFELIDYPGIDHPAAVSQEMVSLGNFAADEIERRAPGGAVIVAGYSLGGSVAFEAARRLVSRGRSVKLLAVFDTLMSHSEQVGGFYTRKQKLMAFAIRLDFCQRLVLAAIQRLWPEKLGHAQRFIVGYRRVSAARRWRPQRLGIQTFYVSCEQTPKSVEAQWRGLCPDMRALVRLPGGHHDLFTEAALAKLTPAFEAAVRRAAALA